MQAITPGKTAEFNEHLFKTWIDFKSEQRYRRADLIREMNDKFDRKYTNDNMYKWLKNIKTLPEQVLSEFVLPDYPDMLEWYFKKKSIPTTGIDFKALAQAFTPSIKDLTHPE